MNRRSFIGSILALGAAPAIVRASSLMPVRAMKPWELEGWEVAYDTVDGPSLLTPSIITRESLSILENNLLFANLVNRRFENYFAKVGTTLTIRKPSLYFPIPR